MNTNKCHNRSGEKEIAEILFGSSVRVGTQHTERELVGQIQQGTREHALRKLMVLVQAQRKACGCVEWL